MAKALRDMSDRELAEHITGLNKTLEEIAKNRRTKLQSFHDAEAEVTRRKAVKEINPGISDHALLRYIERVNGFDVEGLRSRILTPELSSAIRAKAARYSADGICYVIREDTVVTVTGGE